MRLRENGILARWERGEGPQVVFSARFPYVPKKKFNTGVCVGWGECEAHITVTAIN